MDLRVINEEKSKHISKNGCRMKILKNNFMRTYQIQESLDVFETTLQCDGEEVI